MSHLGDLIQSYQDQHGASDRALAMRVGVSSTLVGRWKRGDYEELPKPRILRSLARQLGTSLETVVEVALKDTYYVKDGEDDADAGPSSMNLSDDAAELERLTQAGVAALPTSADDDALARDARIARAALAESEEAAQKDAPHQSGEERRRRRADGAAG